MDPWPPRCLPKVSRTKRAQDVSRVARRAADRRDPPRGAHHRSDRRRHRRRSSTATSPPPSSVIENDDEIDDLTHSIEDRTFLLLARQQPIATDLRFLVTVMRVGHELERSADLMVNVAKTTRRLYPHQLDPKLRGIIDRMGAQASNQTRVAIDAFADSDPSWAAALADMDDAMDELTKSLFRHILASDSTRRGRGAPGGADGAGRPALRAHRRPRGHDRRARRLHGDRRAPDLRRRATTGRRGALAASASALFVVAEVPLEDQVLALGVARDALAVAAELRVVRRQELEPGERPLAELVDHAAVAEDAVHFPVRRDRAEVHDLDVSLRRDLLFDLFGRHRHDGQGSGRFGDFPGLRLGFGGLAERHVQRRARSPSRFTIDVDLLTRLVPTDRRPQPLRTSAPACSPTCTTTSPF